MYSHMNNFASEANIKKGLGYANGTNATNQRNSEHGLAGKNTNASLGITTTTKNELRITLTRPKPRHSKISTAKDGKNGHSHTKTPRIS